MKNGTHQKLKRWSLIGIVVIFLIAGLWHFLYVWLPGPITAVLCPVNESLWEHAKLFFMPALIYFIIGLLTVGKAYPNFAFAHAVVLPLMLMMMLGIYYLFSALGIESLALDLVNTVIVITAGLFAAYRLTVSDKQMDGMRYRVASLLIVLSLLAVFAVLTYFPPHVPMFRDSNTLQYGIPQVG